MQPFNTYQQSGRYILSIFFPILICIVQTRGLRSTCFSKMPYYAYICIFTYDSHGNASESISTVVPYNSCIIFHRADGLKFILALPDKH